MNRTGALIRGLQILSTYDKDGEAKVYAHDDVIYAGPDNHMEVSDDHACELDDLGWQCTDASGRWVFYP